MRLEITEKGVSGGGFRLNPASPLAAKAKKVLDQLSSGKTVLNWCGASVPIVALLASVSKAEPLLVGFGSGADRIHAPNESFSVEQFRRGYLYAGLMLAGL